MATRIALVIGACSGLGYSSVMSLAKSGVHIIGTYRSQAEFPEEVVREVEWLGSRAVMLKLDARQPHLQPFALEIVEALETKLGASKLDNVIINTGTVIESSVTRKLDHWQFYVTHVRLPHLLTEAIGDLFTDTCEVVFISSIDRRGSGKITSSHRQAIPADVRAFQGSVAEVRPPHLCRGRGEDY